MCFLKRTPLEIMDLENLRMGGVNLHFNQEINWSKFPYFYTDASTTNSFYMINMLHDIFYNYGFDEASGNFQKNNYGKGGFDNDFVINEVQDHSVFE